jgi:hypothetical protein
MIDRRLATILAVGLTGIVLIVGLLQTPPEGSAGPTASGAVARTFQPGQVTAADPMAPLRDPVAVVDGFFDSRPQRTMRGASRHKNQSKLFFAHGSWWGVLNEPATREARIMRLDWETQRWHDTGVVVDDRSFARADVLFHDDTLYVASAGGSQSPAHAVRVSLFGYDPETMRWSIKPDYPVTLTNTGVTSSVIERADDGTLWVTFIEAPGRESGSGVEVAGNVFVSHSGRDPHTWVNPYRPFVAGTQVAADQVGMVAVSGEVLMLWSNQKDDAIYASSHRDGRPDGEWAESTAVLRSLRIADDHVNIKALPDGRVFAAVKTSLDTIPSPQAGWDQILLLARTGGQWTSSQVGQIRDKHTRPIVVLDTADSAALVFATAPFIGGDIVMKASPFANLRFPVGAGVEVIAAQLVPRLNNATSTKQHVDASTGLVVLASDDTSGRYAHLAASLGGPAPGVPTGDPPDGPEPAPREPVTLLHETSDVSAVGSPLHRLWELTAGRADGKATYVRRSTGNNAVRIRTSGGGELRVCRGIGATSSGRIQMSMDVRLDRQAASNTFLLMARGAGVELGSIRVDDRHRVRLANGAKRENTDVRIVPGRWYRAELDIDTGTQTLSARLLDANGRKLLERTRLSWRDAGVAVVEKLCVESSSGSRGLGMTFDEVRVTRIP